LLVLAVGGDYEWAAAEECAGNLFFGVGKGVLLGDDEDHESAAVQAKLVVFAGGAGQLLGCAELFLGDGL